MTKHIILGSRGSPLALAQVKEVSDALAKAFGSEITVEVRVIKTLGDKNTSQPLDKLGRTGIFVKELEKALLDEKIDIAVHSMKDLPVTFPPNLILGGVLPRKNASEVIVTRGEGFMQLTSGSKVGTGSLRRKAQILNYREDLEIIPIRGNLNTRLRKLKEGLVDALVTAWAALHRLGRKYWQEFRLEFFSPWEFVPAAGQGVIALEVLESRKDILKLLSKIIDVNTYLASLTERTAIKELGGGCHLGAGAYAEVCDDRIKVKGMLAGENEVVYAELEGDVLEAVELGETIARMLKSESAILEP